MHQLACCQRPLEVGDEDDLLCGLDLQMSSRGDTCLRLPEHLFRLSKSHRSASGRQGRRRGGANATPLETDGNHADGHVDRGLLTQPTPERPWGMLQRQQRVEKVQGQQYGIH
jgi:hypothetical protein